MSELITIGREIVQNAPQLYIDIDVEADGKAGYGSLLSIGAVTPYGDTYYAELKPSSEAYIESQRMFCEEHNLERERLVREGRGSKAVMTEFAEWTDLQSRNYGDRKPVFTAFNAAFDYSLIDLEFAKNNIKNPYGIAPFCIKSLAMAIRPEWDWKKTSKDNLPPEVLPDGDFTHNALEDAIYQQHIHFGLAALIRHIITGR